MFNYNFSRNNLDRAVSPYLRQHQDNPVWWQQWSVEVLEYAARADKPVLVSVGYSTCHWCHVMAGEAFSDQACADALNKDFVCIKVDREERPDIDQLMMSFLVGTTGQGGWPLNVFMSSDLKPFYALTYAGATPRFGRQGLPEILGRVLAFYRENRSRLTPFVIPEYVGAAKEREPGEANPHGSGDEEGPAFIRIDQGVIRILGNQSREDTDGPRFPPHSSLLYALHREQAAPALSQAAIHTLDLMQDRGLHDHVGGGFFRYCVDKKWTIPHFEKMLYDQALNLWNYCTAARRFGRVDYRRTVTGIIHTLKDSFLEEGLFNAALDADTNHHEGATYLWTPEEIRGALSPEQAEALMAAFDITEGGNFEGRNHLVRRGKAELGYVPARLVESTNAVAVNPDLLETALAGLRTLRRQRPQPFVDRKKQSLWNALTGVALLQAERHGDHAQAGILARQQLKVLLDLHWKHGKVAHASLDGQLFSGSFMGDHAAMLLLLATHHEDSRSYRAEMLSTREALLSFRTGNGWIESHEKDFLPVPAETFDSPVPSSVALAEAALAKTAMVLGEDYQAVIGGRPGIEDFRNFAALASSGEWYLVSGPQVSPWAELPLGTTQGEGTRQQYCHAGQCRLGKYEA